MTFKIEAEPTFKVGLTIVGQGRKQKLECVFRSMPVTEWQKMLEEVGEGNKSPADFILSILESWNADADLTKETLERLDNVQPGALVAIMNGYGDTLRVEREKN